MRKKEKEKLIKEVISNLGLTKKDMKIISIKTLEEIAHNANVNMIDVMSYIRYGYII